METSFIYLHRKITDWEWYQNTNTFRVFIHCLLKANYKDKNWQGITIKRGQFVTSQYRLADETGLSRTAVKHALKNLQKTNELTYKSSTQNTIITVVNYDAYQKKDPQESCKKSELIKEERVHHSTNKHTHYNEKNVCVSESEKRILEAYARKSNARNIDAYVKALIKNGGYVEILEEHAKKEEEKKKAAAEKFEKEKTAAENAEKETAEFFSRFETKEQALEYLKKNCGNFINPIQKELMKRFGITVDEVKNA